MTPSPAESSEPPDPSGTPGPRPARWTAVLNPAAGRGRARARLPAVVDALGSAGLDIAVHVCAGPEHLVELAGDAFAAGRGVVACGGDGTVSAVAAVAAGCGGVLGIVPTGSGNDLARHLGIPRRDLQAAVGTLRTGTVAAIDLGRADAADGTSTTFTTVANAGFDAEANRWANTVDRLTGTPIYVLAVLRTLREYRPRRVRVTVDGTPAETEAWLVAVANSRSYASGMVIAPDASLHDGLLDVCVIGAVGRGEFLRRFPTVFRGTHVRHPMVTVRRGRQVRVEVLDDAGPPADLWASGERVGPLPALLTAVPHAARVVVPAAHAPTLLAS